jgi:hypothetical protein
MTSDDAEDLRTLLLYAVTTLDAQLGRLDAYGQRYPMDVLLEWRNKRAMVRMGGLLNTTRTRRV